MRVCGAPASFECPELKPDAGFASLSFSRRLSVELEDAVNIALEEEKKILEALQDKLDDLLLEVWVRVRVRVRVRQAGRSSP